MAQQLVTKMQSSFLTLGWKDFAKGLLVAAGTALLASIYATLQAGAIPTMAELKTAGLAALAAGISYLAKQFFSGTPISNTTA